MMRPTYNIKMTNWQSRCVETIEAGLLECKAQQASLDVDVDHQQCKKWISVNKYPFGLRQNHPYDVWRQEIKILDEFFMLSITFESYKAWRNAYKKPRKSKPKNTCDKNQLTLF